LARKSSAHCPWPASSPTSRTRRGSARSLAQPQHLQIAQMRASETGRPMLRATNTGMTAIVTADGNVQAALEPFTTAVLKGEIRAYEGMTPYARFGNWLALALMAACGLLGLSGRRLRTP
jgi:apolipoprotein N-acyltransferase